MKSIFVLVALASCIHLPAVAQPLCSIEGIVTDSSDRPAPGSTVLALFCPFADYPMLQHCPPYAEVFQVTSNSDGEFRLDDLPRGEYRVIVAGRDLASWSSHGFWLEKGRTAVLDIHLTPDRLPRSPVVRYGTANRLDLQQFDEELGVFDEPALCSKPLREGARESYRFLWLRSFDAPVLVEIIVDESDHVVGRYKQLDGEGGYDLGKLIHNEAIDVTDTLIQEYDPSDPELLSWAIADGLHRMALESFWPLPFAIDDGRLVLDGASWVVEGVLRDKCHVVSRKSPEGDDPFRRFAEHIIHLSGKRFYYDEVY